MRRVSIFLVAAGAVIVAALIGVRVVATEPPSTELALGLFDAGGGDSSSPSFGAASTTGELTGGDSTSASFGASAGFWSVVTCIDDGDGLDAAAEALLGTNSCAFDTDDDRQGDGVDACPTKPTLWLTPLGDEDCDGWRTDQESYVVTDPNDPCAATATPGDEDPPDAWPVDFNDDQRANMQDVIFAFVTSLYPIGLNQPASGSLVRVDLNGNGFINMQDVILGYVTKLAPAGLNTFCTP